MRTRYLTLIAMMLSPYLLVASAYQPTPSDRDLTDRVVQQLEQYSADYHIRRQFVRQLADLRDRYSSSERLEYLLGSIHDQLYAPLQDAQRADQERAAWGYVQMLDRHGGGIQSVAIDIPSACREMYEYIDTLSRLYDHPTALTLAVWYRESDCRQIAMSNGDGPFQIISQDYGQGALSVGEFLQSVEDYLVFSDSKHDWYARANSKSQLTVDLGYTTPTLSGIVYHGALYNGL